MRLIERFEHQINKTEDGCWIWSGEIADHGGGILRIGGQTLSAYRLSYEIYIGEIIQNLCVCHSCDVRACVNPDHLWLGTHAENMADAAQKNRMHPGEKSAQSKLQNEQVIEIVNLYKTGSYSQEKLGNMFGVKHSIISGIITGKNWKHLDLDRSFRKGRGSPGEKNGTRLHPEKIKRGEDHPSTKVSDSTIKEIKRLYPQLSQRQLAKQFNISQTQVGRIVRGETRNDSR
jgi:predicted XRE-type DNA-binding protein